MDNASMNHYEKQLYSVFKTFDVNNEEALDKSAVHDLCDALQLDERGAALVDTLFDKRTGRVTFAQFRNGLLAVLGGERAPGAAAPPPVDLPLVNPPPGDPPQSHSDDDSSGREVAPKFIFGSKKYGRRSRPQHATTVTDEHPSPRAASASRADTDDRRARMRIRCRRSTSAMESREDKADNDDDDYASLPRNFEHDRLINRDQALALCRVLRMDGIDRRLVERIFEDISAPDTTVGEFFDRLNTSLTTSMDERDVDAEAVVGDATGVASELVLDAWERAGVRRPRRLLVDLGFVAATLNLSDLERALNEELTGFAEEPEQREDARAKLFVAALALSRLRLGLARRGAELAAAERDKLRSDVAEANRRARLLAQEVDENHARIEADLKANVRRAEARYAETARQAAAEAVAERERAASERGGLEAELMRRVEAEVRIRSEACALRDRAQKLETRALTAEERAALADRERARLAAELRVLTERAAAAAPKPSGAAGEMAVCLDRLRLENKLLRDRNDELCAEMEQRMRGATDTSADAVRGGDLSAELHSLFEQDRSEECDSSLVSIEQKVLTHIEVVTKLRDIFESVRDELSDGGDACESCGRVRALRDRVLELSDALVLAEPSSVRSRAAADRAAQTEPPRSEAADDRTAQTETAADDLDSLRRELLDVERRHDDEKRKLAGLVRDLETSLEQMKVEYDRCEEYWAAKLEEERDAHADEQRLGDERLAELVGKIGEYERQFAAAAVPLPTIDEKRSLETQFNDLEDEFAQYRREKEAELAACGERAVRLSARVDALERSREPPPPPPSDPPRTAAEGADSAGSAGAECACAALGERCRRLEAALAAGGAWGGRALRARTARAEAAVQRLHARLAAADLLVKDLYVENCQLAHRRPL